MACQLKILFTKICVHFGLIADNKANVYTMWVSFGVNLADMLLNLTLVFDSKLGKSIANEEEDGIAAEDLVDKDSTQKECGQ